MRIMFCTLFFLVFLPGCKKGNDTPDNDPCSTIDLSKPVDSATLKKYHYDTVVFNPIDLSSMQLEIGSIHFDASVPAMIWALTIEVYDSGNPSKKIYFSIQDPQNNKDSLIKQGLHPATGGGGDATHNLMQNSTFTLNSFTPDEFEIYFEDVVIIPNNNLAAKGYIQIKKEIYWKWPAGIWNGIKYIYPCDKEYIDYCIPIYYLPIKIHFNKAV